MNARKLIYFGVFVITASFLLPVMVGLWKFYEVFQAVRASDSAGFGALDGLFEFAVYGGSLMITGILIGLAMCLTGSYKLRSRLDGER